MKLSQGKSLSVEVHMLRFGPSEGAESEHESPEGEKNNRTELIRHELGQAQHVKGIKTGQYRRQAIAQAVSARANFSAKTLCQVGRNDCPYRNREHQDERDQPN